MPLAVATFRAAHPDVTLSLAEGEPEEIAPRLRAGEFDLALLFEFAAGSEGLGSGLRRIDLLIDQAPDELFDAPVDLAIDERLRHVERDARGELLHQRGAYVALRFVARLVLQVLPDART